MNTTNSSLVPPSALGPSNIAAAFFVGILMLATLFGNFLVCASFYTFRDIRTICNYFIISLSVADMMVALVAMPFWLILQLSTDIYTQTMLTPNVIEFWKCFDILCGTASIMNLAAVSADRHLAITAPYSYQDIITSFRAILIICFVWVYAITVSCLSLIGNRIPNKGYHYLVSTTSFFLPLAAMLVMYARIYVVAHRQARRINQHQNYKTDIKAAKTIAVVIGAFVICWLPFFVAIIGYAVDEQFISDPDLKVYKAIKWMEYLNSCLNPIIYSCLNRTYRRAFKRLFRRWRKFISNKYSSKTARSKEHESMATAVTHERSLITPMLVTKDLSGSLIATSINNGKGNFEVDDKTYNGTFRQTLV